jgi:hypothetical protein
MQTTKEHTAKRAAALATWIALKAIERNPDYFDNKNMTSEAEAYLESSFSYAKQQRYEEALNVMKNFFGKLSLQASYIFEEDQELFEAIGALAQLDSSFKG